MRTLWTSRTRGTARAWARAWTPVPSTANVEASGRASSRVARAEQAAVLAAVMCSPSMRATGAPVASSKTAMTAWWLGSPAPALRGKTVTSLVARVAEEGT